MKKLALVFTLLAIIQYSAFPQFTEDDGRYATISTFRVMGPTYYGLLNHNKDTLIHLGKYNYLDIPDEKKMIRAKIDDKWDI